MQIDTNYKCLHGIEYLQLLPVVHESWDSIRYDVLSSPTGTAWCFREMYRHRQQQRTSLEWCSFGCGKVKQCIPIFCVYYICDRPIWIGITQYKQTRQSEVFNTKKVQKKDDDEFRFNNHIRSNCNVHDSKSYFSSRVIWNTSTTTTSVSTCGIDVWFVRDKEQ